MDNGDFMRNNLFVKWTFIAVLLTLLAASAYPAAAATYTITGKVVDINGNGVPGAKVILYDNGLQIGDQAMTADSGPTVGTYTIGLDMLPWGDYQIVAEKEGKQSSTMLKVQGTYTNYTVTNIALRNYAAPEVPAAASTPTPVPVTPTPTVVPTPTPEASTVPANATATPSATVDASATAAASATPVPTPGFVFTLIPAMLALCIIALKKKN